MQVQTAFPKSAWVNINPLGRKGNTGERGERVERLNSVNSGHCVRRRIAHALQLDQLISTNLFYLVT